MKIKEHISRSLVPRLLISYFKFKRRSRLRTSLAKLFGMPGTIHLFFAFDCPYSLIALKGLYEILDERSVELKLYPVIKRGIENDPNLENRRAYTMKDAVRLGKRYDIEITRTEPVLSEQVGFLSALSEAGRGDKGEELIFRFLEDLWSFDDKDISEEYFFSLYEDVTGQCPPDDLAKYYSKVKNNEQKLLKKGHWEVPSLFIYGEWYLAHERLLQVEDRLNYLGW
jgi:2-hydroxychromene-2-carboxylate isomerase